MDNALVVAEPIAPVGKKTIPVYAAVSAQFNQESDKIPNIQTFSAQRSFKDRCSFHTSTNWTNYINFLDIFGIFSRAMTASIENCAPSS